MTFLSGTQRILWTVSCGAAAFALYRGVQLRLHRRYPAFIVFLTLILVQFFTLVWLSVSSTTYRIAWMCFEPLVGIAIAAMAVEAWIRLSRTLSTDRHLWTLVGSGLMAVGVIASLLSSQFDHNRWDGALQFALWSRRYLASTFAVALIAAGLVAALAGATFTTASGRNVRLHLALTIGYLLVTSAGFIAINAASGQTVQLANSLMSLLFAAVFVGWGAGMRPEQDAQRKPEASPAALGV